MLKCTLCFLFILSTRKGKLTLKPNETFEIYEHRRATSPKNIMSGGYSTSNNSLNKTQYFYPNKDQIYFSPHVDNHNQINDAFYNIRMPMNISPKRKCKYYRYFFLFIHLQSLF